MQLFGLTAADLPAYVRPCDWRDYVIAPAFVNAHDHLHLNAVPPLPHGHAFNNSYEWIEAFRPHFDDPDVKTALAIPKPNRLWHGALKNVLSGATTVMHHDPWHDAFDDSNFPVAVVRDYGWSHSLGLSERGQYGPHIAESYAATPFDQPWFIHLAEGTDAVAAQELRQLDQLRCLCENTVLIHGAGLSEADVDLVIERGATVVWCPSSNLSMLGATLNPRRLFDAGRLALGTDSRLTSARDLLAEMHIAAAHSDLTPNELLELVTRRNAQALRFAHNTHDFIVFRAAGGEPAHVLTHHQRAGLSVVIRAGAPVIADPEFGAWFAACGIQPVEVALDGQPKLMDGRWLVGLGDAAEVGLQVLAGEPEQAPTS